MKKQQNWRHDDLDVRKPSHMIGTEAGMQRLFDRASAGLLPDENDYSLWPVIPTALDPTQAPEGQDTLYLYCAVDHVDVRHVAAGGACLVADVLVGEHLAPADIEPRFQAFISVAPAPIQAAGSPAVLAT